MLPIWVAVLCAVLCSIFEDNTEVDTRDTHHNVPPTNVSVQILKPGADVYLTAQCQRAGPPVQLQSLSYEINQPFDSMYDGSTTGYLQKDGFRSWAVPFGITTRSLL